MKTKNLLLLLVFVSTINIYAQKPKKTYDYKVFAEKFTKNTRGTIEPLFGYSKEWTYIADKIGKSTDEVSKLSKKHYTRIKEEVQKTKAKGLLMTYDNAELTVIQESPIKVANIKIFANSGNDKYTFTLKNCVQTNRTWVLGDDALAEGSMFAKKVVTEVVAEEVAEEVTEELSEEVKEETGNTNTEVNVNPEHDKFGRALLEALKSDTPDKLLALSWTSQEVSNTVKEKTKNEEIKNSLVARFKKRDPNNDGMQKETTAQFKNIKEEHKGLNWEKAEYVGFEFKKQGISKTVNFEWGSAVLQFESQEAHYFINLSEFIHLLDGWKGASYMFK